VRAWWRNRAGVRVRTAVAAAAVVGIALGAGALLLVSLLQRSLDAAALQAVSLRAQDVTDVLRASGASAEEITEPGPAGELLQVRAADGTVLRAVPAAAATVDLVEEPPDRGATSVRSSTATVGGRTGPVLVFEQWAVDGRTQAPLLVVVARSTAAQDELLERLSALLVLGVPLMVAVVTAITYLLTRAALRPVDAIREQADRISARHLRERLPVPVAHDEVRRLSVTLNELLDRLEAAQRAQRRFVADAGHELRSPLATMTTTLEVADRTGVSPSGAEADREGLLAEVRRMSGVVEDLLLLARADEHGLRLRLDDVDLDDLVEAEARRLREVAGRQVQVAISAVRVRGDADRLARVVRNLADNAARHATSTVTLSVRADDGGAVVVVEDDGPGVPVADRGRIFERFVRLDDARGRPDGGSGLGLAIVREIVRGHGGEVTVRESAAGGARFEVRLPGGGGPRG
jgi:signal transduction histidine kinase